MDTNETWTQDVDYVRGGLCSTFKNSEETFEIPLARSFDPDANNYVLYIHKQDDFWGGQDQEFTVFSDTEQFTIVVSQAMHLQEMVINLEREITPSLRRRPCEADPSYSRSSCWRDCYLASLNCSMFSDSSGRPVCRGTDIGWQRHSFAKFVHNEDNELAYPCSCPRPCTLERYNVFFRPGFDHYDESDNSSIWLIVSVSQVARTLENSVTYGILDLLADMGGFLGLLLGYSVLSVLDDLKDVAARVLRKRSATGATSKTQQRQRMECSTEHKHEDSCVSSHMRCRSESPIFRTRVSFVRPEMGTDWGRIRISAGYSKQGVKIHH